MIYVCFTPPTRKGGKTTIKYLDGPRKKREEFKSIYAHIQFLYFSETQFNLYKATIHLLDQTLCIQRSKVLYIHKYI